MNDIRTFFSMAVAVLKGCYPIPWKTFLLTLFCLLYLISPMDLLPDVLPLLQTIKLLEKAVQKPLKLSFLPAREGDVRYSCANTAKLRSLGFTPKIPLEKGLKEFFS